MAFLLVLTVCGCSANTSWCDQIASKHSAAAPCAAKPSVKSQRAFTAFQWALLSASLYNVPSIVGRAEWLLSADGRYRGRAQECTRQYRRTRCREDMAGMHAGAWLRRQCVKGLCNRKSRRLYFLEATPLKIVRPGRGSRGNADATVLYAFHVASSAGCGFSKRACCALSLHHQSLPVWGHRYLNVITRVSKCLKPVGRHNVLEF